MSDPFPYIATIKHLYTGPTGPNIFDATPKGCNGPNGPIAPIAPIGPPIVEFIGIILGIKPPSIKVVEGYSLVS